MKKNKVGYTLLEILVVLVIISIASAMAVLSISHNTNKELETFTQTLVQSLTLAEEQALLQPSTLGLIFTAHHFSYYEYRQEQKLASWQPLQDDTLGSHTLPSGIRLTLKIADQKIPLSAENLNKEPSVIISTNGTITPFSLLIGHNNDTPRYEITANSDGTISSHLYRNLG